VLKAYHIDGGDLQEVAGDPDRAVLRKAKWIDLCDANAAEKHLVEDTLGIEINPVNDYEPFQVSSHYSASDNQLTMTGLVLTFREENQPHLLKVTFIRSKSVLVTVSEGGPFGLGDLTKECENCFTHKSGRDDILAAWAEFRPLAGQHLPIAPEQPVEWAPQEDRPQPRLDRNRGRGMGVTVGRLRPCGLLDWKFTVISHNTIRGAAGAAILNAELLASLGKLEPVAETAANA